MDFLPGFEFVAAYMGGGARGGKRSPSREFT
jgi:hypothetical protein